MSQMASIFKLFSLVFFLGLVFKGDAASCSIENISIDQSKTGNWARGMPEWKVTITNNCVCPQSQVKLKCDGVKKYKEMDPSILSISRGVCLLKNGHPISPSETIEFLYVRDTQFPFQISSSQEECDS
ncbi:TPD1 protein-like 1 [Spatholobus suberectus]|nr:TPD1 protein-like 1 [Spatholobus suberectus]